MKYRIIAKVIIITMLFIIIYGNYSCSAEQKILMEEKIKFYQHIVDSESAWLISLQLSNGAFALRGEQEDTAYVNPYFADYTALALLRAGDGQKYTEQVKKYLDWHFHHLNNVNSDVYGIAGTIYDYQVKVTNGTVVSEITNKKYDSVDSYAASFLIVLWDYYKYTKNGEYLVQHYDDVLCIINAINAVMNDGMTFTKPDYQIKYLMDNAEVYEGLGCAASLYNKVFLPGLKNNTQKYKQAQNTYKELKSKQKKLGDQLENQMWNKSEGHYEAALGADGKESIDFNWGNYYADATSQLFLIIHGVLDKKKERARELYETFGEHYKWQEFQHYTKGNANFYWGRLPYAAAVMKDEDSVNTYMNYYLNNVMPEHKYPLYNADAAWVIMACEKMINLYESKIKLN